MRRDKKKRKRELRESGIKKCMVRLQPSQVSFPIDRLQFRVDNVSIDNGLLDFSNGKAFKSSVQTSALCCGPRCIQPFGYVQDSLTYGVSRLT